MDLFKLGKITSPVGIKGEVRVYSYLDDITRFSDIEKLYIEGESEFRDVERARVDKNTVVIKLSGVDDRNTSESLRNKYLVIPKDMYELPDDTYYVDDLIGMEVFNEDGIKVGELVDINQNSKQDLYVIDNGKKTFLLPAVGEFILDIDIENKKMVVKLIDGIVDL